MLSSIFIDENSPYFATTPGKNFKLFSLKKNVKIVLISDGLIIEDNTLLEIKCHYSAKDYSSCVAALKDKRVQQKIHNNKNIILLSIINFILPFLNNALNLYPIR